MSSSTTTPPENDSENHAKKRSPGTAAVSAVSVRFRRLAIEVGQVGQLAAQLAATAVKSPKGYAAATWHEMYNMFRFAWLPWVLAVGGFCFMIGNYAHDFLSLAGAQNRTGTFFVLASAREIAPYMTGMAVAGVMGTAMTADLGARKIREELDALKVLGVDAVRQLVLPKVLAITLLMLAFNVVGIALAVVTSMIAATVIGDTSAGAYLAAFLSNLTTPEMVYTVIKTGFTGIVIGLACAHKGLNVKGGPAGVGRAVNEAVVLGFVAVWVINYVLNSVMLGTNPDMLVNR